MVSSPVQQNMALTRNIRLKGILKTTIVVAMLLNVSCTTTLPKLEDLKRWANKMDTSLQSLSHVRPTLTQDFENKLQLRKYEPIDGLKLVADMSKSLSKMMSKKMDALWKLVHEAELAAAAYKWNKNLVQNNVNYVKGNDLKDLKLTYVERFGKQVNANTSAVHIPVEIFDGDIEILNGLNWSAALDKPFEENYNNDPDILWQYFGSHTGFMRSFPATQWPESSSSVDLYDVRRQSWYTQGSSSPKDMLILIDKSGSTHGQSLQLMQNAVKSILDTLGENDFVNIIQFSEAPEFVSPCFNHTALVQANFRNKKLLKKGVDGVMASNAADFSKAIKFAFEKFEEFKNTSEKLEKIGAKCNKVIMLLTDGGTDNAEEVFRDKNWNKTKPTRVFTYAVGPTPNPVHAIRWMACANRGFFSQIPAMGAIRAKVQEYVEVLTRPLALGNIDHVLWTSSHINTFYDDSSSEVEHTKPLTEMMQMFGGQHILWEGTCDPWEYIPVLSRPQVIQNKKSFEWGNIYEDHMGLGMMTTVTLPVYNRSVDSTNQTILGVMGIDVTTFKLEAMTPFQKIGPNGYSFAINPNGYVVFHPNLLPMGKAVKEPPNIDMLELEIDENNPELDQLRSDMIEGKTGSQTTKTLFLSPDQRYVTFDTATYSYTNITNTTFRLAIAVPEYQKMWPNFSDLQVDLNSMNFTRLKLDYAAALVAPWNYHKNLTHQKNLSIEDVEDLLKNDTNPNNWDMNLLLHLYSDANDIDEYFLQYLKLNISNGETNPENDDNSTRPAVFFMTNGGLTIVKPKSKASFFDGNHDPRNTSIYKRAQHRENCIFMADYAEAQRTNVTPSTEPLILVACPVKLADNITSIIYDKPAVIGEWITLAEFMEKVKNASVPCNDADSLLCYIVDDGGFLVASNTEDALENIGRFFGEVEPAIFKKLNGVLFDRAVQYDFQAICFPDPATANAGIRGFAIPTFSLLFEVLNVGWWTSKVTWLYSSFSFFSWLFSPTIEVFASETNTEECVKRIQQYYLKNGSPLEAEGSIECLNYTRNFTAIKMEVSNLLFIVAEPESSSCEWIKEPVSQRPQRIDDDEEKEIICEMARNPRKRLRPFECYDQDPREDNKQCGCINLQASLKLVFTTALLTAWHLVSERRR